MTYHDGQERVMAKWAHHRIAQERQRAEDEQRQDLADLDESPCREMTAPES